MSKKCDLQPTEKYDVLQILRGIDTVKPAGIDRLPGRYLKDSANVLAKLVTYICNHSVSLNELSISFKLTKG